MAADKKTPLDVAPISSSSMRAAFSSSPMSVAPGLPKGRRRVSSTATVATASRSAAAWRSRRNDGGWRCTSAVGPGIFRASTSGPSFSICFGICVAPWICSGIAARSIDGERSGPSSRPTRGCTSTISPLTPLSSIRPSTCGRGPIGHSPTEPPTMSSSSGSDWTLRSAAFATRNHSSGPASTPRICRGRAKSFHYLCEGQ
jgi:hypothetical protein